ncbi:MAG: CerR family C-terminal domain-containing protein [Phycisphaerales bacterium]|nr:MAG: CerR family C-terminal domain-containing protein [Phycisphaerales bacterium]
MARRKDGIETRDRILTAACEVFAQKGYHDATVEEICGRAKTNIAAVNYHFGSKDQLYAQVWRRAFDEANEAYPPEGGLGPDAPPEARLHGTIHSIVGRAVDPGRIGHAGKLLLREMVSPTDVIDQVKHEAVRAMHERMSRLMRELLGPEATDQQVLLTTLSVVHQCMAIGIRLFTGRMPPFVKFDMSTEQLVETLTNHITCFSLAGISATRENIEMEQLESSA